MGSHVPWAVFIISVPLWLILASVTSSPVEKWIAIGMAVFFAALAIIVSSSKTDSERMARKRGGDV